MNEDKLKDLKSWMEKYIANVNVDFKVVNNHLCMILEDKNKTFTEKYFLTNYACRKIEDEKISTTKLSPIKVEGCYFSFMCESFKYYHESFINSLKTTYVEACEVY